MILGSKGETTEPDPAKMWNPFVSFHLVCSSWIGFMWSVQTMYQGYQQDLAKKQTKFCVCAAQKILESQSFSVCVRFSDLYRDGCCAAKEDWTGLQKQILLSSVLKLLDGCQHNFEISVRFLGKKEIWIKTQSLLFQKYKCLTINQFDFRRKSECLC